MAETKLVDLLTLTARTTSSTGDAVGSHSGAFKTYPGTIKLPTAATVFLDITGAPGTGPTLALKLQGQHTGSGTWFNLDPLIGTGTGAWTGVTTTVAAGVAAQQVRRYMGPLPTNIRAVATIGGTLPTYTGDVKAILEY